MSAAGEHPSPTQDARLLLIPDALISDVNSSGGNAYALHPALRFISARLSRAAKQWADVQAMAPIEWYAALIGVQGRASALLAAAMGEAVPDEARQCWLFSPFAGHLGRDTVHIMPEEAFAWDAADTQWLLQLLQPLLAGDGLTLLGHGACMLAVTKTPWDARPASFAQVAGHLLPDRHPEGADGGRLMRLCAEMQMMLASKSSERRQGAGLPAVMGAWLWAPSELPAKPAARPYVISDDALVRCCTAGAGTALPVAIMGARQVDAWMAQQSMPRHWLLGGERHALLLDLRAWPRFTRHAWQPQSAMPVVDLGRRLQQLAGIQGSVA